MPIEYETLGSMLAGFGALGSALGAWKAAAATRNAVRMQALLDFAKRDASAEMNDATQKLWKFRREKHDTGDEFRERFAQLESSNESRYKEIDAARRVVHKFFLHLMQAKQSGLVTEKELIIVIYKHQLETVLEVLLPLERVKPGKDYTAPIFREYKRLHSEYDNLFKKYIE